MPGYSDYGIHWLTCDTYVPEQQNMNFTITSEITYTPPMNNSSCLFRWLIWYVAFVINIWCAINYYSRMLLSSVRIGFSSNSDCGQLAPAVSPQTQRIQKKQTLYSKCLDVYKMRLTCPVQDIYINFIFKVQLVLQMSDLSLKVLTHSWRRFIPIWRKFQEISFCEKWQFHTTPEHIQLRTALM